MLIQLRDIRYKRDIGVLYVYIYIFKTTRFESDPIGKVINLSKKKFIKEIFQLLNKNLKSTTTQKVTEQ